MNVTSYIVTGHLGPDDLVGVHRAVHTVWHKWYLIGLGLRIPSHALDTIKEQHNTPLNCYTRMLQVWLNTESSPPTWSDLVQALSSPVVGENRLAEEIRMKYCHGDGEQPSGPAPGEVWRKDMGGMETRGQEKRNGERKEVRGRKEEEKKLVKRRMMLHVSTGVLSVTVCPNYSAAKK